MTIVRVERYGPQYPGEYWWQAYDVEGIPVTSFWTAERNPPQDLIDLAEDAFARDLADEFYGDER